MTKEELDNQLEAYMSKTKSSLDADLDAYMSQSNWGKHWYISQTPVNISHLMKMDKDIVQELSL